MIEQADNFSDRKRDRNEDVSSAPWDQWESEMQGEGSEAQGGRSPYVLFGVEGAGRVRHEHRTAEESTALSLRLIRQVLKSPVRSNENTPTLADFVLEAVRPIRAHEENSEKLERDIEYIAASLLDFMRDAQARNWLTSHNERLSSRPLDAIALARIGAVIDAIDAQRSFAY